jgi:hypothetical protein
MDLEQKFQFFKIHIKSYTRPLCITNQEYGVTTMKYRVSVNFYHKLVIYSKTVGKHLWILIEKLEFFKTCKKSYTRLLCIINLKYRDHDLQ